MLPALDFRDCSEKFLLDQTFDVFSDGFTLSKVPTYLT